MPNQGNPFYVAPPNVSGGLEALMGGVKSMQLNSARQQAMQAMQSGDQRGALARLMSIGDTQGAQAIASFGNNERDFAYRQQESQRAQGNSDRQFGLQQQVAQRREVPQQLQILQAAGIDPASPEGKKALFPKTDTPISATDKREIFKAEDEIPALQGTIDTLNRAKELNPKTFSGLGASTRAAIGSSLPDLMVPDFVADKAGADATTEWKKLMSAEAISAMASSLKGATTDFELKKFETMLADPATPPKVREAMITRMATLAERQMQIKQDRMKNLRGGDYFKPGGGQGAAPSPAQSSGGMTREQYNALPSGSPYTAPDGSQRVKR